MTEFEMANPYGMVYTYEIGIILAIELVIAIAMIVAMWRIFTKAGEAGWKSLIPIYNFFVLYKIAWKQSALWLTFLVTVLSMVCARSFLLFLIFLIVAYVLAIKFLHRLSKAFGKGILFTLGLIFFYPIFIMILGFGSAQYVRKRNRWNIDI